MEITRELAQKVLETVDAGLVAGAGRHEPGQMCVEAAVCYAMGLPHGDRPTCVSPALRLFKIELNDAKWSSNSARAAGLRRLAIVQLGSAGVLDEDEFRRRIVTWTISTCVPVALRAAASIHKNASHKAALLDAAGKCELERSWEAALTAKRSAAAAGNAAMLAAASAAYGASAASAYAYAYAASAFVRDKTLSRFAEDVVQILIEMKAPGAQWLELAPLIS